MHVSLDGHARHSSQLQHVEESADGDDDDVDALHACVDGVRDRSFRVHVRVAVGDEDGEVLHSVSVAVTSREHAVFLR